MGQQYSSPSDGPSAGTSPHNTASSSPPTTRADATDMRPSPTWGSNANAVMSSIPGRSETELGEHLGLRPKTENEVARMSIRAVIDTFIENCLSANNDNSPQAEDKLDDPQVNGGSNSQSEIVSGGSNSQSEDNNRAENNESSWSRSLGTPKGGSDCPVKAADSKASPQNQRTASNENPEVNELGSEDGLVENSQGELPGLISRENSQGEQPGLIARDKSQGEQPGLISRENSQGEQPGLIARDKSQGEQPGITSRDKSQGEQLGITSRDKSQGEQLGITSRDKSQGEQPASNSDHSASQPVQEKDLIETSQKMKTSEQGSSNGTLAVQARTSERQTFSAYLQERLKTIDLDKHEELTQLALSKNIHCQGQMFMWEMIKKPIDDYDSASQSVAHGGSLFSSGPVRLQTVIDRVLDKSLLNQDQPLGRGRDNSKDHLQNASPGAPLSAATARERASLEIQGPVPSNKTRLCFKDHIEKVLLESFLSFEEEERAEALRAEAQKSVETGGNKISSSSSKVGNTRSSVETDSLNTAKSGKNRPSGELDKLDSSKSGKNRPSVEIDRLDSSKSGKNRPSGEIDRLDSSKSVPSVETDRLNTGRNNRSSIETDSEKLNSNKDGYYMAPVERDRVNISSDGTISVQDIVDQVINQTEMISRLLTPSARDSIKLAPPTVSSDSSVQSLGLSTQSSPGLRYQGSSHNRALLEAQRHAVHKEHQSSTTLGRKRGRPRLGSPVNTSVKCMTETAKPSYQDPRCGPMTSQVGGHPHTPVTSRDYLLTNHFSPGAPSGFSPSGTSQVMRPPASTMFQQGHDMMQKPTSKCLTGPVSSGRQLHPHDSYHQQHGGHHFSSHPHQLPPLDSGQMSSSNVHPQQIQVDRVKESISSSNRLVPVSHIPTKSCSCHSCLAHFSQRKSPSQVIHIQQHIHHHPFSKTDSDQSHQPQAHQPQAHHPSQAAMPHMPPTHDYYSQTISPNKKVPSPVVSFSGQGLPQTIIPTHHLTAQTHKKDPASRDTAGESGIYSGGHYQSRQGFISQPSVKPPLFDPRFAGTQGEHFIYQEDTFQRVTKDKDPHLVTMEAPKQETSPLGASMIHEADQPLDLSVKPCPTMRSGMDSDRTRQGTEIRGQSYMHSSSLPPRSEASMTEFEQQTPSGHHLQKLESSVDRFLLHRHSQPQSHLSLYTPGPHGSLYPQGPHFSQHRPRMSQFHAAYHVRPDVHGGHHLQDLQFSDALSPGHITNHPSHQSTVTFTHPPSPAIQQPPLSQPHQSPVTFTHPPSPATQQLPPMSQQHHRQDMTESLAADQYQTSIVLVDNLPWSKDTSHPDYSNVGPARSLGVSDYQRPPSHNQESRPEGTPLIDTAVTSSPSRSHSSPSPEDGQKQNFCKHEPIQNIIGNHPPSDILYLICLLCRQTYGSPYGFRKHFRNQHGFEPKADHTVIQTISATKTAMAHTGPSETTKRPLEKHREDLYIHGQSMKSSPGEGSAAAPHQQSPDAVSSDDCKLDLMKELPATTKYLECPECGQTFQLNDFGSYKRHCRQHSLHRSSDPFACHDCERSFSEPTHLQDHLATHSSFTPSVCGICRTFFSSPSYLASHLLTAHGVGSDSGQRHVDLTDNKAMDSTRKCVSEPVLLADTSRTKSTLFSDLSVMTSPSQVATTPSSYSATPSISGHSSAPSTASYSTTPPSSHIATPSISGHSSAPSTASYSTTPSSHIATPSISGHNSAPSASGYSTTPSASSYNTPPLPLTQSTPSLVLARSLSSSVTVSKHRFATSSEGSHMFTVHTPKGLEIQKLPADAVVTSASPDSSYDEAKLRSDPHPGSHPTENVSATEVSSDSKSEGDSNSSSLDNRKVSTENVLKKADNTSDKKCDNTNDKKCDNTSDKKCDISKDEAGSQSSDQFSLVMSGSMSRDSSCVPSPEVSETDKLYQHKKYSRHRKRVTDSDGDETKSKCQKVVPREVTDRAEQPPFLVSSTLNSAVTIRDCESSCSYSEDSSLSFVKGGEGKR